MPRRSYNWCGTAGEGRKRQKNPKVALREAGCTSAVLDNAKKLKLSTDKFKKICIKKDTNPSARKETIKLRDVTKKKGEAGKSRKECVSGLHS